MSLTFEEIKKKAKMLGKQASQELYPDQFKTILRKFIDSYNEHENDGPRIDPNISITEYENAENLRGRNKKLELFLESLLEEDDITKSIDKKIREFLNEGQYEYDE